MPSKDPNYIFRTTIDTRLNGYWHQCPRCQRNRTPKTNAAYWSAKFQANQERDQRNQADLQERGYQVLVIWECQVKEELEIAVDTVRTILAEHKN